MTARGGARSAEAVARVEDVHLAFGDVSVLEGVAVDLEPGSVAALIGPNGSGKTTLLRIVAGLLAPDEGQVEVDVEGPRSIGYLPQSPDFRPAFTVAETLDFYARLLDGSVDADAALRRVGLASVADRRVEALSGGMRRLLGVAQATLGDPPVVLLDEPTGDLDPRMTEHIFSVVDDVAASGAAVLLATHDLVGAARADSVLVLDRGAIVAEGPPEAVAGRAGTDDLVAAFLDLVEGTGALTVRTGEGAGAEASEP